MNLPPSQISGSAAPPQSTPKRAITTALMPAALVLISAVLPPAPSFAGNWPQWRGPHHNGISDSEAPPTSWSETENIVWKTELPWWSGSTPAVWGDRIFVASPARSEHKPGEPATWEGEHDPGGSTLHLICLDRATGEILWNRMTGEGNHLKRKHNMTSPSPVTDGEHVWIITGTGNLICFDMEGTEVWRRNIQEEYGNFGLMWGYANSPLLYKDRLIIPVLHGWETDASSFLFAADKKTGRTIWRAARPTDAIKESPDSYSTPQLAVYDGRPEVIINGGDVVTGNDPETGRELWRVGGLNPKNSEWYRIIASVVCMPDMIFVPTRNQPLLAVRPGARGDATATHVAWETKFGPDVPSPVSDGRFLYVVDDNGRFNCLDAKTGEAVYNERIARGTYSASLVLAADMIYAVNESAVTTIVATGPEFRVVAENTLDDEYTLSSPVIVDDELYIRTSGGLYRIGSGGGK